MAKLGNKVDAFDISENAIEKEYDGILSHGVLHLPYKDVRDKFISKAQGNTKIGKTFIISSYFYGFTPW